MSLHSPRSGPPHHSEPSAWASFIPAPSTRFYTHAHTQGDTQVTSRARPPAPLHRQKPQNRVVHPCFSVRAPPACWGPQDTKGVRLGQGHAHGWGGRGTQGHRCRDKAPDMKYSISKRVGWDSREGGTFWKGVPWLGRDGLLSKTSETPGATA